jgi:hypothetical protein
MTITEVRERFLNAIVAQIPADRITEIHFFQPIRQGGVESAVAVVAADEGGPNARQAVYTARYRHTLKGVDRGKWETNVVGEADAPLVTVDTVVRGVQRRAGDVDSADRMTGDEVRAMLAPTSPTLP